MPAPFSKCLVVLGKPIARAADGTLAAEELDEILMELMRAADERVGLVSSPAASVSP